MEQQIKLVPGDKITAYTSTFPARRYWYRHDAVEVDGKRLDGYIQVRSRGKRIESITCFQNSCVLGSDVNWLRRMNSKTA
jgi:hypothetical protein